MQLVTFSFPIRHWQRDCNPEKITIRFRTRFLRRDPAKNWMGEPRLKGVSPMPSVMRALTLIAVLSLSFLTGCNNALNPLCGSARPVPVIGSISPTTLSFTQVQSGGLLTVNGSHFVSTSQVVINGTPLSATVVSDQELQVTLSTAVILAPGAVSVAVKTPSGNSGDVGCSSGGTSSTLTLTVN
jgi:IPT/TIG domain